jgi:chemotaxis protein MotB
MAEQPIIKKVIKKGGHAHHGGAWKLAYADFVTAMMAFFLLMWLLGSTTEETRKGISEYFENPYKAEENAKGKAPPPGISGELSEIQGKIASTDLDLIAEKEEKKNLAKLKEKIEKMIQDDIKLSEAKDQIKLEITPEGLRVQIVDSKNKPMFKTGSSEAEPQIRTILSALAPVINSLPNKVTINGHTDAQPFSGNRKQYTNWELSSERANAARFVLNHGGLGEDKIIRVAGLSASIPFNLKDPLDPMNRRISIMVMNKKTEKQILEGTPVDKPANPKDGKAPAPAKADSHDPKAAEGEHQPAETTPPPETSSETHEPPATPEAPAEPPKDAEAAHQPEAAPAEAAPSGEAAPPPAPETHEPPVTPETPAAEAETTPPPEPEKH